MARTKSTKQKPWNKIVVVMKSGNFVSPDEFKKVFASDPKMLAYMEYKLSYFVHIVRKMGGVIKTSKNGRRVIGYQLVNVQDFDDRGEFIDKNAVSTSNSKKSVLNTTTTDSESLEKDRIAA